MIAVFGGFVVEKIVGGFAGAVATASAVALRRRDVD